MSPLTAFALTVLLLAGSGFFVAAEFALVAARRHRVEQAVADGRRGARSALAGMRELSLMLAGAQLGITVCTLGLGGISKPAISARLDPLLVSLGLPTSLSYVVAFLVAMLVVVFLHMVVGEMAPKSWAIAHPERSAMLLAPAFRAVTTVVRPLILLLNRVSNALVRLCRVTPREELTSVHNREQLTQLVKESQRLGLISRDDSALLTRSLTEPQTPVGRLMVPAARIAAVPASADVEEVLATAARHDLTRLLVVGDGDAPGGGAPTTVLGSVHVRDAMVARHRGRAAARAATLARPVPELRAADTAADAIEQLRQRRASLAVIRDADGALAGLISLDDLMVRLTGPLATAGPAGPAGSGGAAGTAGTVGAGPA
ncbi:HlyC/CorC family transporter [Streptomyces durbertensis]|uniref:HlyC/CorC family transporter n=1 Tax=Streptomyces durbertensis TaxID=2448886 RepID=A0ABR6EDX4_9ACTN|nr:hemolysin family protein [Streptomyces durbertensis]MBB1242699.1 HlyC/CorC family transporter [Streptomyces durbertensis]